MNIQAFHLLETGKKEEIAGALELLDLSINRWPSPIELESAHLTKAHCLEMIGKRDAAIEEYRLALEARKNKQNVRTNAPLDFALFGVKYNRVDLYDEIIFVLGEFVSEIDIIFPFQKYQYFTALAIIANYQKRKGEAKEYAIRALNAVDQTFSGLSYHPQVGLVTNKDKEIIAKLWSFIRK